MVIFDQLRISDDGQKLYLNAHINKAKYFEGIYINKITICTEDQISEVNPEIPDRDFVYQKEYNALDDYERYQIFDKTQVLSERKLLETMNNNGGWQLSFTPKEGSDLNGISITFSGKYSQFETGFAPKMLITTPDFNPNEDTVLDSKVLFSIEGTPYQDPKYPEHKVWQFKGKDYISNYNTVCFYVYKQVEDGIYEYVRLDTTDDINFLHFYWNAYSFVVIKPQKEVNMVFTPSMFNEKFTKSTFSDNMFFVYIECIGVPDMNTPCTLDEKTTLGVTFDYGVFFNQAMNYTRDLVNTCTPSQQFIDFILNIEALKIGIETDHYIPAIQRWKWLMEENKRGDSSKITKSCGCHG